MPHDLFGDVVARPPLVRSRRSPLVCVSLAAHGTVLAALVLTSIVAPDALPFPQKLIASGSVPVLLVDIPLPRAPAAPKPAPKNIEKTVRSSTPLPAREPASTTPLTAPSEVTPETGNEGGGAGRQPDPAPGDWPTIQGSGAPEPPPTPVAQPEAPVRLHSGIRAPRKVADIAPVYPALAQRMGVAGVVILEATIDALGVVQSARVLRSVPLLDQAAVDAVRQWRFEPARLNGRPIAVVMTVTVNFTIGR